MIRVKTSLDHKRIRRLIWLVLTFFVLLFYSLQSAAGITYYSMLMEPNTTVTSPSVILEEGNCSGTTTIYTNKTSAKVSVGAPMFDYVDNNDSDEDSSSDKGTHSNFTAQQYGPDYVNDTLTEENIGYPNNETRYMTSNQHTVNGLTAYNLSTTQTSSYLERSSSQTGTRTATWGIRVWKRLSNGTETEITGGSKVATVSRSSDGEGMQFNTWNCSEKSLASTDAVVVRVYVDLEKGDILLETFITDQLGSFKLDSATWTVYYWTNRTFSSGTTAYFRFGDSTHNSRIENFNYRTGTNYQLDLEVQWTNLDYDETNEELCIYGGTMGSENVTVDAWNGTAWKNLFTDLSSGWNNVSVTSYLTSSDFTIRFKGGNETGDTTQDSWNIDATLLHLWTGNSTYDYVLQVVNQVASNWTINLQVYDNSSIARLSNTTISFHDGSSSDQIIVSGGSITQSEGPPYNLTENATIYISMSNVKASASGTSYLYVYLKILVPDTTTYSLYVITFEIT